MFRLDVFNTEAHPFIAPPAKDSYGSGKLASSTTDQVVFRHWESPIYKWARRSRPGESTGSVFL
jgi:hypothetical protein